METNDERSHKTTNLTKIYSAEVALKTFNIFKVFQPIALSKILTVKPKIKDLQKDDERYKKG